MTYKLKILAVGAFVAFAMPVAVVPGAAKAQQGGVFMAQVMPFAGNFAPRGWAFADGQLVAISQNTALFSLLGTTYGGDGRTTFALPDLRGRIPIHPGRGPGLSTYRLGERGGVQNVTLTTAQLPSHNHPGQLHAAAGVADGTSPGDGALAEANANIYLEEAGALTETMAAGSVTAGFTGGGGSHTNIQPFIAVNWIIALQGIYPSRN